MRHLTIRLTSPNGNGNTVAYLNLTDSFCRATTGKYKDDIEVEDITAMNDGDFLSYIRRCKMEIEPKNVTADTY